MAAMSTVLTVFADNGNARTYTYTGHTAVEPRLVLQKRRTSSSATSVIEDTVSVLSSTKDAANVLLASKVLFSATCRRPVNGVAADVSAALAVFRDIVASDEFTSVTTTQKFVK